MTRLASLLRRVWADDRGSVVTAEITLILAIFVIGLIPGLVALRNATNASLATLANILLAFSNANNGGGSGTGIVTSYQSFNIAPVVLPPSQIQVDPTP